MSERLTQELERIASTSDNAYEAGLGRLRNVFQTLDPNFQERKPAAVCVLFRGSTFKEAQVLLTLRSGEVTTHANQVAFPGGSLDDTDRGDPRRAAIRECHEEVGILPELVESIAVLEAYPTFGGSFIVHPVLAQLKVTGEDRDQFVLSPQEVVFAEWVSVTELMETRRTEERAVFGHAIPAPYFMWGDRKMWGLSAWIFDSILNRYVTIGA